MRMLLAAGTLALASGCVASNQFGLQIRIDRGAYRSQGEPLEFLVGVPAQIAEDAPLAVFLEGDGSQCQDYREGSWRRFLVRHTGRFLLVRPRTFVNTVCATERFAQADFLHRVAELGSLLRELRRAYPGRPTFLVGHSAGAQLAVLYAKAHPGEISGIANLGGGTWPLSDLLPEIAHESARRGKLSPAEARERLAQHQRLVARLQAAPDSSEPMWGRSERFWSQMFFSGVRELWAATELPVLVIHGTEDLESVPASAVAQARDEMANAGKANVRFVFLEGEGHDLLRAEAFQLVEDWMQSLRSR
jgi:pimeloyl-ACP methyl ester carboxylesterase